jgi:hypothetical protein
MRLAVVILGLACSALAATPTTPSFYARRDYPSASGFVAVADVNGDGIPDIIAIRDTIITTLLGSGNGTFRTGPSSTPGGNLVSAIPIDLNGDGKIDLLVVGSEIGLGGVLETAMARSSTRFTMGLAATKTQGTSQSEISMAMALRTQLSLLTAAFGCLPARAEAYSTKVYSHQLQLSRPRVPPWWRPISMAMVILTLRWPFARDLQLLPYCLGMAMEHFRRRYLRVTGILFGCRWPISTEMADLI